MTPSDPVDPASPAAAPLNVRVASGGFASVGVVLTIDQLVKLCPKTMRSTLEGRLPSLQQMLTRASASTPKRAAMMLAQTAFESNYFRCVKEDPSIASGPNFEHYDFRASLGNCHAGDGAKYCGRDYLQCTGAANYKECGEFLGLDLVTFPELLELPENLGLASAWYWAKWSLNSVADVCDIDDGTCRINGGHTKADWIAKHGSLAGLYGVEARRALYTSACLVFNVS
jgi:putative chitinase